MSTQKLTRRQKVKYRVRKVVKGDAEAPRLSVFRSNKGIYVQVIDDVSGKTLVAASSLEKELTGKGVSKTEQAKKVGSVIAERANQAGIKAVRFDRNGFLYHGRVKALAEAAREAGLKF